MDNAIYLFINNDKGSIMTKPIYAAFLAIGDELLSGRTQDKNLQFLASNLQSIGIDLAEARFIHDQAQAIGQHAKSLSQNYDYVFTSGGIGPTHDDITTQSLADAFNVKVIKHQEADLRLQTYYQSQNKDYSIMRQRMALIPEGASLIDNPVSIAPGFILNNIYVMAGVPAIFQAMLNGLLNQLQHGQTIYSQTLFAPLPETYIAQGLEAIANHHQDCSIGCYPSWQDDRPVVNIVVKSVNKPHFDAAVNACQLLIKNSQTL